MRLTQSPLLAGLLAATLVLNSGCVNLFESAVETDSEVILDAGSFPYHPLVYHLDLSILAYQLYGQTLVWPFDPYYEEADTKDGNRDRLMDKVKAWADRKGAEQLLDANSVTDYRGPGVLNGFANNPHHDPILYAYDRIQPWNKTLTNADGTWTEYKTPKQITKPIKDVRMCYRTSGAVEGAVSSVVIPRSGKTGPSTGGDTLLAFEGGTGDKGEEDRPSSQSLMGMILVRKKPDGHFDLHIAFRGSRSGKASRAVKQAFTDRNASGNPDWITDLGYNRLAKNADSALISTVGSINRGFARSMKSILPNLFHCLGLVDGIENQKSPDNIYVTGHSLGGALAQDFVGAVLLGNQYGPAGAGPKMPARLTVWPWKQIKLITYGAPRTGDAVWARTLTEKGLQSEFFTSPLNPGDVKALGPTNAMILPRLLDVSRPAGFRVLDSRDPITTEKVAGGKHVGKTVYVNKPSVKDLVSGPNVSAHEQQGIRKFLLDSLADPRIPRTAMLYRTMAEINPTRDAKQKGSVAEIRKLAVSVSGYYERNGIWFDQAAFDKAVTERLALEEQR